MTYHRVRSAPAGLLWHTPGDRSGLIGRPSVEISYAHSDPTRTDEPGEGSEWVRITCVGIGPPIYLRRQDGTAVPSPRPCTESFPTKKTDSVGNGRR